MERVLRTDLGDVVQVVPACRRCHREVRRDDALAARGLCGGCAEFVEPAREARMDTRVVR